MRKVSGKDVTILVGETIYHSDGTQRYQAIPLPNPGGVLSLGVLTSLEMLVDATATGNSKGTDVVSFMAAFDSGDQVEGEARIVDGLISSLTTRYHLPPGEDVIEEQTWSGLGTCVQIEPPPAEQVT